MEPADKLRGLDQDTWVSSSFLLHLRVFNNSLFRETTIVDLRTEIFTELYFYNSARNTVAYKGFCAILLMLA